MPTPEPPPATPDAVLVDAWRTHRRRVVDVAARLLGSHADAEDVAQETFARLVRQGPAQVDDIESWLVVVVTRLCLDELRSAQRQRRRAAPGPFDDLPLAERSDLAVPRPPADPADRVTLDEGVQHALHRVLAHMSPPERTAFVLHDVFQVGFEEIASIVGRSPGACRQLASRARRRARDAGSERFSVEAGERRELIAAFARACASGDLDALLALLDPDVSGQADLGPPHGKGQPAIGADAVARTLVRYFGPGTGIELVPLGDDHGDLGAWRDGRLEATVALDVTDGRVHHLDTVLDPRRLASIAPTVSPTRLEQEGDER